MSGSPSITTVAANGGFQIAFIGGTGDVEATGTYGTFNINIPSIGHTSPSITGDLCSPGEYELAWHAPIGDTGTLWEAAVYRSGSSQAAAVVNTNQAMNLTSSPSTTSEGSC
jgi:hypothetical protein